jgi:beta-galactosidase GanA
LIDVLLPGVWKPPSPQNWKKLRFWHAGTPFGQFDIICSETSLRAMKQYRSIVFPGWNSMNRTLYRKLVSYVRSGGTLFMSLPQLSTRVDREFLEDAENPKLVNDGDLAELFGIRIPRKRLRGSARTAKVVFAAGNGLLPGGRTFRLSRPVACAGARLTTARPLARTASGQPVLVENRIGKGTARLLLTNEYPGASPLRKMMRNLLQALAVEAGPDVRVDDPAREVAWYLFEKDGVRHLWLHNTDWVIRGNVKTVTVREAGRVFQVDVKQGIPLRLVL